MRFLILGILGATLIGCAAQNIPVRANLNDFVVMGAETNSKQPIHVAYSSDVEGGKIIPRLEGGATLPEGHSHPGFMVDEPDLLKKMIDEYISINMGAITDGLGKRIRRIRKDAGLNQRDLGLLLGVGITAISDYETGNTSPSPESLAKIAELGKVSLDWLITGREDKGHGHINDQDPNYKRAGAIDRELLRLVIEGVEQGTKEAQVTLPPEKKAELVLMLCDLYAEEKQVDMATVLKLIRLAA